MKDKMIDDTLKKEILDFITEEAVRIRYGKLYIELLVVNSCVLGMDIETKRKVDLRKTERLEVK